MGNARIKNRLGGGGKRSGGTNNDSDISMATGFDSSQNSEAIGKCQEHALQRVLNPVNSGVFNA